MNTGLDPEVLVVRDSGEIVPASCFLGPPLRDSHDRLNPISYDNAAIEIRPHHSKRPGVLVARTATLKRLAVHAMNKARRKGLIPLDSHLTLAPAAQLSVHDADLESVRAFGCSPSRIVQSNYSTDDVVPMVSARETTTRSAGFHIHQELRYPDTEPLVVAVLDGLLGLLDVLVNHRADWSEASRLRRLHLGYGRAGEFRSRESPTGARILEYRVLSPWPLATPRFVHAVVSTVRSVCTQPYPILMSVIESYPERSAVVSAINHADHATAQSLWQDCTHIWLQLGGRSANAKSASSRLSRMVPVVHAADASTSTSTIG